MDIQISNIPETVLENEFLVLQDLYTKGDDIQKLSVIQALPQLLQYDPNGTLTRIVPKIQQELPKSSCEFHIATSKIFKLLIEKQLPLNLTGAVIQGTESKDPVVSNAWIETLLAVIPILPIDQIKAAVVPLALSKSQPSSPVYSRVASCKIFGKCASHPKMQSIDVKTSILPAVQSLCQDCFQDVRATMCSHLHLVAQGLGEALVKTSLLPSLVELASDDNMAVRSSAVASAVLMIPYLNKQTKIETIVPLIKQLCTKTSGSGDTTFPTIAREFGKLVEALQNDIDISDCVWILQFFKTVATKGQTVRLNKDNLEVNQDVLCREQCAFNLPAVTSFTILRIPNQLDLWHSIFSGLANDSCYLVRKTTAASIFDIAKILGPQCKIIKDDLIKLLRDDAEEVLQMLVPHVGSTLESLCTHGVLSRETNLPSCLEITRALLKCQLELSKGYNWRIRASFLQQLERLPNCMPSDFIHQHFSPVILNCVLESRPKPVRSQASRTLLVFLRYNLKEIQRKWIRDNLTTHLCYSKNCYTRHIFVLACGHAAELFSNTYFKKHFFEPVLSLADDPVSNIRLCVVGLLPVLYKMLVMPEDRKLQTNIDNVFSKLDMIEKDRDVKDVLKIKLKEVRSLGSSNKQEYMMDQKRKEEEENKIFQGKITAATTPSVNTQGGGGGVRTQSIGQGAKQVPSTGTTRSHPTIARSTSAPPRVSKSPSVSSGPSDMSFLEQHFYIDAGITLPRERLDVGLTYSDTEISTAVDQQLNLNSNNENKTDLPMISTISVENVDIETMSETELKKLETSTTNITDDIKVDIRKRNNKKSKLYKMSSTIPLKNPGSVNVRFKRYSSVFPMSNVDPVNSDSIKRNSVNRRSLNMSVGDTSKIPICVKKSPSNADIKCEMEQKTCSTENDVGEKNNSTNCGNEKKYDIKRRNRPKSEILTISTVGCQPNSLDMTTTSTEGGTINAVRVDKIIYSKDLKTNDTNRVKGSSSLPVLKRRTQSEAKSK